MGRNTVTFSYTPMTSLFFFGINLPAEIYLTCAFVGIHHVYDIYNYMYVHLMFSYEIQFLLQYSDYQQYYVFFCGIQNVIDILAPIYEALFLLSITREMYAYVKYMHVVYICAIWVNQEISDQQKLLRYKVRRLLSFICWIRPKKKTLDSLEEGHISQAKGNHRAKHWKENLDEDRNVWETYTSKEDSCSEYTSVHYISLLPNWAWMILEYCQDVSPASVT